MAISIFNDKAVIPNISMVTAALADTYTLWTELQDQITAKYPNVTEEWKHYGKAAGWGLKLLSKKRNLLFFIPLNGHFRIRLVLGEKAVTCVEKSNLPDEIKKAIHATTPYTEGRSIDINISQHEQLETIRNLLKIKFEN
jgi:hypothetical protein